MTNWNICEDPYPGPDRHMTMQEAFLLMKSVGVQTSKALHLMQEATEFVWEDFKKEWFAGWSKIEPIIDPEWTYDPNFDNRLMFRSSMTEEERREHALKCRQNRNTGPRRDFTFHHDGRRLT